MPLMKYKISKNVFNRLKKVKNHDRSERSPSEWMRHVLVARKGHQCALPQAGPLKDEGNILHQPWLGWMVHLCRVLWMKAIPRPGEPLVEVGGQSGTQEAQLLVSHSI